jgi:hypothetical protein
MANQARHTNPAQRLAFDAFLKFESSFCAPPAPSGRVGALDRSPKTTRHS